MASAAFPLIFGHVLLSASVDLVAWPLVCLFAMRAVLRADPRWWLAVGLVIGLATYNKLLIGMLIVGLAIGVLAVGPRRMLREPLLWIDAGIAARTVRVYREGVYRDQEFRKTRRSSSLSTRRVDRIS